MGSPFIVLVDHYQVHAVTAAWGSQFAACSVVMIDGVGDGFSSSISLFQNGFVIRIVASPARSFLGVFFEYVTNFFNMRELEDEGKVMVLVDYVALVIDENNFLLGFIRVRDGVLEIIHYGRALRNALVVVHWGCANEQFAFLVQ